MRTRLALLAFLFITAPAFAHSWYDKGCCSGRDCEALADGDVQQTVKGYHVRYTGRLGFHVDVTVPYDKARPSRDGQFHGCASVDKFLCLYAPMGV